jgi:hypothetical protein
MTPKFAPVKIIGRDGATELHDDGTDPRGVAWSHRDEGSETMRRVFPDGTVEHWIMGLDVPEWFFVGVHEPPGGRRMSSS